MSNIHHKGWGFDNWIVNKPVYCGKLLYFREGKMCSWHYHKLKDETFYVGSGRIQLLYGESDNINECKSVILKKGDSFHIYPGLRHRMIALEETDLYEFSTEHFEEDSYRIIKGD